MTAETRKHIRLENLSRTSLPADIERALRRTRFIGVEDGECLVPAVRCSNASSVQLRLFRFLPTRQAYITITHPDFLQRNIAKLGNVTIGGHRVTAVPCLEPPAIRDLRGIKGRKAFIERRPFPAATSSGAMSNGRQVCVWGFPPKASVECVKDFLEQCRIDTLGDKPEIHKVHL